MKYSNTDTKFNQIILFIIAFSANFLLHLNENTRCSFTMLCVMHNLSGLYCIELQRAYKYSKYFF